MLNSSVVRLASWVWHVLWCLPYWVKCFRLARERHGTTVLLLRVSLRGLSQVSSVVARMFARRPGTVLLWWSQYCLAACGRGWGAHSVWCLQQAAHSWPCMSLLSVFALLLWVECRRGVRWRGRVSFQ